MFFTGLSGSGKSTIANALMVKLMEMGGRPVTLLDGDVVRKHLSSELGFSKEHRDINIKRIGYVASEITKNGGIAICAPIAPYTATRRAVREMIEAFGAFIEVHVATSVEECERRDRKGLYKLAREGKIKEFTGISDPYEAPTKAELVLDTEGIDVDGCAHQVHPEAGKHGPDQGLSHDFPRKTNAARSSGRRFASIRGLRAYQARSMHADTAPCHAARASAKASLRSATSASRSPSAR